MTNFDQFELNEIPQPTSDLSTLVEGLGYTSNSKTSGLIKPTEKPAGVQTYIQPELPPRIPPKPPIQFTNEGVVLRQGVMKSPNHVRNLQGWQITSEGEGEFNSLSVRNVLKTVPLGGDINSTLTFVGNAGGGEVHLAAGTYYPTSDIVVPSNVTLRGTGAGTIIDFDSQAYQIKVIGSDGYSTGTVAVTNDATTVTGSGTSWTAAMIGRSILLDGLWYPITNVSTSTSLTIEYSYAGADITGDAYAIANWITGSNVEDLTVQNSTATTGAIYMEYLETCNIKDVQIYDSDIGLTVNHCSGVGVEFTVIIGCGTGNVILDAGAMSMRGLSVIGSTGVGFDITSLRNAEIANFSCSGNGGTGMELTSSSNIGIVNFSFDNNTGKGIEMVSNNDSIQVIVGTIVGSTSDGIKLTATTDKCSIGPLIIENSGGYGINIAASTCDDNLILGVNYLNNFSGSINDSGTDTILVPNTPSFIAAEDLTKGQPVGISNYVSGQVARAFNVNTSNTLSFTAEADLVHANGSCAIGGDKLVFLSTQASNTTLYATVVSVDPDTHTVSVGTSASVTASRAGGLAFQAVCKLDTDKFVVIYRESSGTSTAMYRVGTVSGTTITFGTAATFVTLGNTVQSISVDQISTDKGIAMLGCLTGSSSRFVAFTASGTTLTMGTPVAWGTTMDNEMDRIRVRTVDTDKFIGASFASTRYCQIGTLSGTTITLGTEAQFSTTASLDNYPDIITLSSSLVVFQAIGGSNVPYYIAASISGTTPTAGTTFTGTQYDTTIVKDSTTSFLSAKGVDTGSGSINKFTISGTTITDAGSVIDTAPFINKLISMDNGYLVGIFNSLPSTLKCWIQGMSNQFFGFAESTVSAGGSLGVVTSGKIGGLSNLIPGATYQITSTGLTLVASNATVNSADDKFVTASSATEVVL